MNNPVFMAMGIVCAALVFFMPLPFNLLMAWCAWQYYKMATE